MLLHAVSVRERSPHLVEVGIEMQPKARLSLLEAVRPPELFTYGYLISQINTFLVVVVVQGRS